MIMKVLLETFNDKGEITDTEICKDEAEAVSKSKVKQYYRVHKCYHDEVPWKPCEAPHEKKPVVEDEVISP